MPRQNTYAVHSVNAQGRYVNNYIIAYTKSEAAERAPVGRKPFLVTGKWADRKKVKAAMVEAVGHHNGIA